MLGRHFLFSPSHWAKKAPFVRDAVDTKRYMSMVIIALIPCVLLGIYNAGYQAQMAVNESIGFVECMIKGSILVVPIIITSYAVGGLWEGLFACVRRHPINEGFSGYGLIVSSNTSADDSLVAGGYWHILWSGNWERSIWRHRDEHIESCVDG